MKHVRHLLVAALTVFLAAVLAVPAFAEGETKGSITIDNATKGITYRAYKLFDATYSGNKVSYKVPAAKKDSLSTTLFEISSAADSDGNFSFWVREGVSESDVITWVKANYSTFAGSAITGAWANESTYVFSNLDFGYYYVTSSLGTVVTIDSAVPNANVKDKNDSTPEPPDKEIVAEDATAITPAKLNDAGVGSTESFEVTFNAVNWVTTTSATGVVTTTQAKVWKFTDTPTGLAIDPDTVRVYVTDNGVEKEITSTITDKTVSDSGVLSFNIPWIDANGNSLYQPKVASGSETQTAKIPVRVTYDATILASAAIAVAPNTIEVKYTNSDNQDVTTGTDSTETFTYKFELQKTDQNNKDLIGAKFELYKGSVADANKVKFSVDANGVYIVDPAGTITEIDLTTVSHARIQGLDKADYVLHETVVPKGYNQAADQTVASTALTRVDGTITNVVDTIEGDQGVVNVVNRQGTELPSTGGMGTTILYIVGGGMVIAGIVMFLTKRRMSSIEK